MGHMTELATTIDTYLEAYGETDETRRRSLISKSWSPTGTLTDPPMAADGHDGIATMFAAVQGQFPGHTFRRTTEVDTHHNIARYGWELVGADGSVAVAGMDVARVGDDGFLVDVTGFFGPLVSR
jgi:hypothetical protein